MTAEIDETRRLRDLLTDTIVLLCKTGVHFSDEVSIEALVGITVDRKNVILVSIRETISVSTEPRDEVFTPSIQAVETEDVDDDVGKEDDGRINKWNSYPDNRGDKSTKRPYDVTKETSCVGKKRFRRKFSKTSEQSDSVQRFPTVGHDLKTDISSVRNTRDLSTRNGSFQPMYENVDNEFDGDRGDVSLAAEERFKLENSTCFPGGIGVTRESRERSVSVNREWGRGEGTDYAYRTDLAALDRGIKMEDEGVDVMRDGLSEMPISPLGDERKINESQPSSCYDDYVASEAPLHPILSSEEIAVAAGILSIPGCFINMGCVKAVRQSLRRVSKETLVTVLERMSVPESSPYFVGAFRSEGVSRTFYKCPPDRLHPEALALFNVPYPAYVSGYYEPVRYPNNLKDPTDWILRWKMFSPFPDQRV